MNKIAYFICFGIAMLGTALFIISTSILKEGSRLFGWCIGLGSALIILGVGFLFSSFLENKSAEKKLRINSMENEQNIVYAKMRAGYLVCKIMNILLCIYLLILDSMKATRMIIIPCIALIAIQYLLDLFLQIYFSTRR
ncbi:MAG TPA: hypothetical protein VN131_02605 [Mobilitalea sp.]|nr:hypothetical protein [Mobilitalea sp.]